MKLRLSDSFLPIVFVSLFVLAGCDAFSSEETVILNSSSSIPPTVEYTFEYTPDDLNSEGRVEVTSEGSDNLDEILRKNGFSRDDVVSARIERVVLDGPSPPESSQKIYEHVRRAEIYFPGTASTPVAEDEIRTEGEVELSVVNPAVTSVVQEGAQNARLELDTQEGGFSERHRAEADIYFRIELEGV